MGAAPLIPPCGRNELRIIGALMRSLAHTRYVGNLWFLNFLTCRKDIYKLALVRRTSLLKLPAIGATYADRVQAWQPAWSAT